MAKPKLTLDRSEAVLSAQRVSKIYRMGEVDVHALNEVDFSLHAGELVVLLLDVINAHPREPLELSW